MFQAQFLSVVYDLQIPFLLREAITAASQMFLTSLKYNFEIVDPCFYISKYSSNLFSSEY